MKAAIIDDLWADRVWLENILAEYAETNNLELKINHFSDGESFLQTFEPFQYSVIFLDVYMNGISGVETAKRIRDLDESAIIVFLSNTEEHRPDAFSLSAAGYLLKPCEREDVFRTMDHVRNLFGNREKQFSFTCDKRGVVIRQADILCVEAKGSSLIVTVKTGKTLTTRMNIADAEKLLDQRFLLLMKGVLVNMDYILQIKDNTCRLRGGKVFTIRFGNRKEVRQKWLDYTFTKIRTESLM